ncbi:E3 ubiquitin-protein ligase TRAF7 [Choanephora cucurbitarum]|uniref:E3 ubiquitin-protein ligase TRAF7 n=1 Tax=Choanephora cucurbitarum TaxID=101091 RepID=A0A1C7MZJ5_9FUNG|nr:E3 ubiquitin-protein ligase TRAF7 [Choanephora cucurbitarum]
MSRKVDLLLDEPCPELLCGICSDILEDPIQVHCPEDHMFCNKCIQAHVGEKQLGTCPICLTLLDNSSFQLSKFVQRQVGRLRIKCPYTDIGCRWQGLLSDQHVLECEFQPQPCPNANKGCDASHLNQTNMKQHSENCLYQTINCPNQMPLCQPFLLKDLSKHENECQSYACPYASEGCPFIGTMTQAKIHCDGYCGSLHQKIDNLEQEVKRLNKLIQEITIGLDIKLPSTPDHNTTSKNTPIQEKDAVLDEMSLLHQMLSSDPFGMGLSTIGNKPTTTENTHSDTIMEISPCLPDMSFLENTNNLKEKEKKSAPMDLMDNASFNALFDSATSPQPLEFVPPVNVPKRTSNGKKIRYSKNVRLAHSALRMARQRTQSSSNPSNDAILNNFQQMKSKQSFKNLEDVTRFLTDDIKTTNKPTMNKSKKKKHFINGELI